MAAEPPADAVERREQDEAEWVAAARIAAYRAGTEPKAEIPAPSDEELDAAASLLRRELNAQG